MSIASWIDQPVYNVADFPFSIEKVSKARKREKRGVVAQLGIIPLSVFLSARKRKQERDGTVHGWRKRGRVVGSTCSPTLKPWFGDLSRPFASARAFAIQHYPHSILYLRYRSYRNRSSDTIAESHYNLQYRREKCIESRIHRGYNS